jgi:hypothetical protein
VNRPTEGASTTAPPRKRAKIDDPAKHTYPAIPEGADDEESTKRNLEVLKGESQKPKPRSDVMKDMLTRTFELGYHIEFEFYCCGHSQGKSIS